MLAESKEKSMSTDLEHLEDEVEAEPVEASGSLSSRMESRATELANQRSDTFEVPGWDDILAVELRLMGWQALRKIAIRNNKVKDAALQELYIAIDQIVAGTDGFYEVKGESQTRIKETWTSLARRTGKRLPEDLTPRQAVIALVGDTRVMTLYNAWQEWMKDARREADEELVRDFIPTG